MKRTFLVLLLLSVLSCNSQYKYETPEQVKNDWKTGHIEDFGADLVKVNLLIDQIETKKYKNVHSLLIVKKGKLVFEEYFEGYNRERRHDIASVTKSITSALVGIAVNKKHIESVSNLAYPYYKNTAYENKWDSLKKQIRIKDLLTMRHGLDCNDFDNKTSGSFEDFLDSDDYISYMLDVKMKNKVDEVNAYCTGSTQLLEPILRISIQESVEKFAKRELFDPLGINSFKWGKTPKGNPATGMGADMTPRDMARFGLLYLNKGKWGDNQIISEDWINESLTPYGKLFDYVDYGYMWYIEPPVKINGKEIKYFDASGHGGQTIAVYPELDMVIVITAGNYNNESDYYEMLEKYVLPIFIH